MSLVFLLIAAECISRLWIEHIHGSKFHLPTLPQYMLQALAVIAGIASVGLRFV
jgi:hypothetical protein